MKAKASRKATPIPRKPKEEPGWQAQKSALTRNAILDAAIDSFVHSGYATTTTERIAELAGVSRGAMLHHFPSKAELIEAAVEHLHEKLVELYTVNIRRISQDLPVLERNRRGLDGYWRYLNSDLFTAYHELCIAGRTDPVLQSILNDSIRRFDGAIEKSAVELFPEWAAKGELFDLAMDISKFMLEGMAVSQIVGQKEKRVRRVLDYLADRLEEIFTDADTDTDTDTAIQRHSRRK